MFTRIKFFFKDIVRNCVSMATCGKPIIIGVSGVTNGGKTTLTQRLIKCLPKNTVLIKQDDYFYPQDSAHHIPCPGNIKHHNWEVLSAIDMDSMVDRIRLVLDEAQLLNDNAEGTDTTNWKLTKDLTVNYRPIILLDGFILFDDHRIRDLCTFKFFITLSKDICKLRRSQRVYDPPDPLGYFDECVWPMYEEHLKRIKKFQDIVFIEGNQDFDCIIHKIKNAIMDN